MLLLVCSFRRSVTAQTDWEGLSLTDSSIPVRFRSDFDSQAVKLSPSLSRLESFFRQQVYCPPRLESFFKTRQLSCFMATCVTLMLVDTLNSPLRNLKYYENFPHHMVMHDCPYLSLCHILAPPSSRTILDCNNNVSLKVATFAL